MRIKRLVKRAVPSAMKRYFDVRVQKKQLAAVPALSLKSRGLRAVSTAALGEIMRAGETQSRWLRDVARIDALGIPDGTGGVNPGDRRAIYHLVAGLRPHSVLEIGTHIGASTVHIATALAAAHSAPPPADDALVSVDIADVNEPSARRWAQFGSRSSPRAMIQELGCARFTSFVVARSLEYLRSATRTYDFIFLDGDHSAHTVYEEVAAALRILAPGGVILLHDYFPELKPLWRDGSVKPGPCLAIARLISEGAGLAVLPLGELPWGTKLNSHRTSLALLAAAGS